MVPKALFVAASVLISCLILTSGFRFHYHNPLNLNSNASSLAAIELPDHVNAISSSTPSCSLSSSHDSSEESAKIVVANNLQHDGQSPEKFAEQHLVKVPLKHRTTGQSEGKESVIEYTLRDLNRIHILRRRITENKNQNAVSRLQNPRRRLLEGHDTEELDVGTLSAHPVGSLKAGVSLGLGEYFMDMLVGTPPKHFSLIVDTGSDLNWIQCMPCYDCFEQNGPHYDPKYTSSFKNISCQDPWCDLVSSPDPPQPC